MPLRGVSRLSLDLARPFKAARYEPGLGTGLLVNWVGRVCYLAWAHAYLGDETRLLAEQVQPYLLDILDKIEMPEPIYVVSHIAVWQDRCSVGDPDAIIQRLSEIFDDGKRYSPAARFAAGEVLATAVGARSGVSSRMRAKQVLEQFPDCRPSSRLQLLGTAYREDPEAIALHIGKLIDAARSHHRQVEEDAPDPLDVHIARGRTWSIAIGPVADLVRAGNTEPALALLGAWFGLAETQGRKDDVLFAMREMNGIWWARQGRAKVVEAEQSDLLDLLNEALDTSLVDPGRISQSVREVSRGGKPNLDTGDSLHTACARGLRPEAAVAVCNAIASDPAAVVNMVLERAPLAFLIAEAGGPVLPTVTSMEAPLADRSVERAQLWVGDSVGADEEIRAVRAVLSEAGAEVEVVRAADAGVTRFRDEYQRKDLDLLWVTGHAEFGHQWVEDTKLILSSTKALSLRDLMGLPRLRNGRRLLVLNSCESGTVAGLGGPSTVGIGGMLAGGGQAVVSHLWPVGYREAARFGGLLALGLARDRGFLPAFDFALRKIIDGPDAVRDALHTHAATGELADRWDPADSHTFLGVASPCLLE